MYWKYQLSVGFICTSATLATDLNFPLHITGAGQGGEGAMPPPPFGTEQALNAEVYRMLSARSYSDAVHISI